MKRHRARRSGIEFDITVEDVPIPDVCPLLGIPIIVGATMSQRNHAPSLDRIDPKRGYVKGNVWVVSFKANSMKRDATIEEVEMLARNLRLKVGG